MYRLFLLQLIHSCNPNRLKVWNAWSYTTQSFSSCGERFN